MIGVPRHLREDISSNYWTEATRNFKTHTVRLATVEQIKGYRPGAQANPEGAKVVAGLGWLWPAPTLPDVKRAL